MSENQNSTLFLIAMFRKLVSNSTLYGGPSLVLYEKNIAVDGFSLHEVNEFF